jgi:hypothetical protein
VLIVGLIGALVSLIGVVPVYLAFFHSPGSEPRSDAGTLATGSSATSTAPTSGPPTPSASATAADEGYAVVINSNADALQNVGVSGALHYFIPWDGRPGTLPPRPADGEFVECYEWAHANGGEDKGVTVAQFTITAQTAQVVAESIQLEVLETNPLPTGTEWSCGGGDILPGRFLDVKINTGKIDFFYGSEETDEVKHAPFGLLVKPGEAEKVQVLGHFTEEAPKKRIYTWRLKLNLVVNGKKYTKLVDNDGVPFKTVV